AGRGPGGRCSCFSSGDFGLWGARPGRRHPVPAPGTVPGAMNENEGGHVPMIRRHRHPLRCPAMNSEPPADSSAALPAALAEMADRWLADHGPALGELPPEAMTGL